MNATFSKITRLSLLAIALFVCSVFCSATPALAKDYELTKTDIVATVNEDATMNVTQSRTFEFDGNFSLMMIPLGSSTEFTINSATLNAGGQDTTLEEVPFQTSWRKSGGAGKTCYSIDKEDGTVYVFTDSSASTQTVKLDYTYPSALKVHDDVAELYWQFVTDAWEKNSNNVSCTINVPIPQTYEHSPTDIKAWGHGNLSGKVLNVGDGRVIIEVDKIKSGNYAETRVVFPTSWLNTSVLTSSSYVAGNATDSILTEEKQFADNANALRSRSLILVGVCIALPIIFLIVTIFLFFKFGKEYVPQFKDEYWRDLPDPDYHPAVVARNERWDKKDTSDISATIMHLHVNGFIAVESVSREKAGIFKKKNVEDLLISEVQNAPAPTNAVDIATMKFLFEDVKSSAETAEGGARQVYMSDISEMGKDYAESAKFALDRWQTTLDGEVEKATLFETAGAKIAKAYKGIAGALIFIGVLIVAVSGNLLDGDGEALLYILGGFGVAVVIAILAALFSKKMNRRTHHANEVHAKTKALKKWLCEFTQLDERPALDTKVWGEFMVYATILGVADKAIEQMKIAQPSMFDDDAYATTGYLPWWFWCSTPGMHSGFNDNIGGLDALNTAFSDFTSAFSSGASGDWSSGEGFGGGFSIGGGGGFGGGGFGGAR